jgi:hypothetical protein
MHGPTCIFRANLTPFPPQVLPPAVDAVLETVRAFPGRLGVLSVSPSESVVVWRFCMGVQGAEQPKTAVSGPGSCSARPRRCSRRPRSSSSSPPSVTRRAPSTVPTPAPQPPRRGWGSVVFSFCTTSHPLYTIFMIRLGIPLFLKRQCDRTLGAGCGGRAAGAAGGAADGGLPAGRGGGKVTSTGLAQNLQVDPAV